MTDGGGSGTLIGVGIADHYASNGGVGTYLPNSQLGDYIGIGSVITSGVYSSAFYFYGADQINSSLPPPQLDAIYTIMEVSNGNISYNINDNGSYSGNNVYTSIPNNLTTTTRSLFVYCGHSASSVDTCGFTINIVNSVN